MTRVAIYARFSSQMQSEASIEDQLRICRDRVTREGWTVTEEFSDMAISGASMQRPGVQRMMDEASRGSFDVIVSEALDRLSRDQADVATLFKRLSFYGVKIITLSEGEISELHVGLKGTMNQLFLKDLAAKTRRGLRGRVEAGRSGGGNAYGYDVIKRIGSDGEPIKGERMINTTEAEIVRRIFQDFANGHSPKAIARKLNDDSIPGPRGKLWRDTAIRGHRTRGTGILNNELYIGRLVWNRLRYVKDPATGKRVSRMNPQSEWVIREVPELRIIDDEQWTRAKERQEDIDATPAVQGIKRSRFWEKRRKTHLLSGLLSCGACGGTVVTAGKDYVACSNARKLGTCTHRRSYKRGVLEDAVLGLLRDRLMQPDAVAAFVDAFTTEVNSQRGAEVGARKRMEQEHAQTERKVQGLYDAIAEGLRTPGLIGKLEELEAHKAQLAARIAEPDPTPVRLHPKLSELYREKVGSLATSLQDPDIRPRALETIRGLITRVTLNPDQTGGINMELEGAITAMIEAAQAGALSDVDHGSVKVVAGVGFEPTTFRL